ncbi:MAG: OstA-like protein [Candidatus Cryptobacteroides sp.]|nr:OstA-like protein [Candidatus Cryptobacteroides sp.]
MAGKGSKIIYCLLVCLLSALRLSAQEQEPADSLVRLVKAQSIELYDQFGRSYRKTIDATFLHNGTYLICDTAIWCVDTKIINCWGHVQLVQDETVLTSDKLDYLIDEDLAQFRGSVVQLRNKKDNLLRTRNLDYNTKDSIAVFRDGGAMRDQDGQVVESREGTYNSTTKLFTFRNQVNMFTDSVFVKTSDLVYDGEQNRMEFVAYVDFWKDGNMLSAGCGWYNRDQELFFFERDVHGLSADQEVWCDTLYFYRNTQDVEMFSNVHIQDSSRNVAGMSQYLLYQDSISRVTMCREAAVAMRTEQETDKGVKVDTLYMGADSLVYWTEKNCDIKPAVRSTAQERLAVMLEDPVGAYRARVAKEAAEKAAQALEELAKKDQNVAGALRAKKAAAGNSEEENEPAPADEISPEEAALAEQESKRIADSLERERFLADSIALANDTTKIGFAIAVGNVKLYRKDMQVRCDSLNFTDLDSIARFYINPIVWNDGNRQYTADSLSVLIRNGGMDRASLMSNAFIITQEDSLYFDQIKGADVMAYFDTSAALKRFDALGGAMALFYLKEDDAIATVNKVECKMMSANMVNGELDRVYYYDSPKNDAYPLAQLPSSDKTMKGFNWNPDIRPQGRQDITTLRVKSSEREYYESRPRAVFRQTDIYFPGYMKSVYSGLEEARKRKREAASRKKEAAADTASVSVADTTQTASAMPAVSDTSTIAGANSSLNPAEQTAVGAAAGAGSGASEGASEGAAGLGAAGNGAGSGATEGAAAAGAAERPDTVVRTAVPDSLARPDSLAGAGLALSDSTAVADTVKLDPETLRKLEEQRIREEERQRILEERRQKRAEKEAKRQARREAQELRYKMSIARRDAKWARLDSLDAIKDAAKAAKKLEKQRARTRVAVREQMLQDAKDQAKLQKYIERYQRKKEREEARKARKKPKTKNNDEQEPFKPSGERAPETQSGREISTIVESGQQT